MAAVGLADAPSGVAFHGAADSSSSSSAIAAAHNERWPSAEMAWDEATRPSDAAVAPDTAAVATAAGMHAPAADPSRGGGAPWMPQMVLHPHPAAPGADDDSLGAATGATDLDDDPVAMGGGSCGEEGAGETRDGASKPQQHHQLLLQK